MISGAIYPYDHFREAMQAVLRFLHSRVEMNLWMLTRTEEDDWIVLFAEDHGYGVKPGRVLRWSDSFCSRMVQGLGPMISPRSAEVPAYLKAPIGAQVPIGSYIGLPICRRDGRLFGTLCAIDPAPQSDALKEELPIIESHGRLLATLLAMELEVQEGLRKAERLQVESQRDPLTGLLNRRGWDQILKAEEQRCKRYGNPSGVLVIDLDDLKKVNDKKGHAAGDRLLRKCATLLSQAVRRADLVSRLGGDEFAVLSVESNASEIAVLADRIRDSLEGACIHASIGWDLRDPRKNLQTAFRSADRQMYREKKRKKSNGRLSS